MEIKAMLSAALYFANTIERSEMGRVISSSMVPLLISSVKRRIEMAGIKNINTQGARAKNASIVEYHESNTLF
jgi:hypothetical protein